MLTATPLARSSSLLRSRLVISSSAKSQSGCKCAGDKITVVTRSDSSGTTLVFTSSLNAFCKFTPGAGNVVKFPVGTKKTGNSGVSAALKKNKCAIGYVGSGEATSKKFFSASVQNKSGKFVAPSSKSISAALGNIKLSKSLTSSDANPAGSGSYPIVTLTWMVFYKTGNGVKGACIKTACHYFLSKKAQGKASKVGYAPLPAAVVKKAVVACKLISA